MTGGPPSACGYKFSLILHQSPPTNRPTTPVILLACEKRVTHAAYRSGTVNGGVEPRDVVNVNEEREKEGGKRRKKEERKERGKGRKGM